MQTLTLEDLKNLWPCKRHVEKGPLVVGKNLFVVCPLYMYIKKHIIKATESQSDKS